MRFPTAPMAGALLVTLALVGCAAPADIASGDAGGDVAPAPSASSSATPTPTPEPAPTLIDPADVTKWTVTAAGVGPIERGAAYLEVIEALTGFEAHESCTGVVTLEHEAGTRIGLDLTDDGTRIDDIWVFMGSGDASGALATEAGIHPGSSTAELTTAYPDLTTVVQRGADSWVYAVGSDAAGWIDFMVDDEVVILVGASDSAGVPKEWCA